MLDFSTRMAEDLHQNVFLYGTIKRKERNYYVIKTFLDSGSIKFLGEAKTVHPYPLIIASRYQGPFLLDAKGQGKVRYIRLKVLVNRSNWWTPPSTGGFK